MKILLPIVYFLFVCFSILNAQNTDTADAQKCKQQRFMVAAGSAGLYTGGMGALYNLWYKDYAGSGFHWFNDNREWLQMDKLGHVYSAYHFGESGYIMAKHACFSNGRSLWLGGGYGLLFLATIEMFDGFSSGWGASAGDLIANASGYLLFTGQQHFWNEQRFRLKFSYFPGKYAQYRPELLGGNQLTRIFKDYNAQTYWLSFSPVSFSARTDTKWPQWLCFSIGYSGDGLLGGTENPDIINNQPAPQFSRNRQYFCSMDIDFSKIRTDSKAMKIFFYGLNMIKMPFPAVSYCPQEGVKIQPLGF